MRTFGTRERIAVGVAIVAAALLFFGGQIWGAFIRGFAPYQAPAQQAQTATTSDATAGTNTTAVNQQNNQNMKDISTVPGLQIYDERVGTGAEATAGHQVTVHYIGTLTDGTKFDSSVDRGQPFTFDLGAGQVIPGWDKGVAGMKVGGVRKLVISPDLAYGDRAIGKIPANSTLVFEVQLLDVK